MKKIVILIGNLLILSACAVALIENTESSMGRVIIYLLITIILNWISTYVFSKTDGSIKRNRPEPLFAIGSKILLKKGEDTTMVATVLSSRYLPSFDGQLENLYTVSTEEAITFEIPEDKLFKKDLRQLEPDGEYLFKDEEEVFVFNNNVITPCVVKKRLQSVNRKTSRVENIYYISNTGPIVLGEVPERMIELLTTEKE